MSKYILTVIFSYLAFGLINNLGYCVEPIASDKEPKITIDTKTIKVDLNKNMATAIGKINNQQRVLAIRASDCHNGYGILTVWDPIKNADGNFAWQTLSNDNVNMASMLASIMCIDVITSEAE